MIESKLDAIRSNLKGKVADEDDLRIIKQFPIEYPSQILNLLKEYEIIGQKFSLPEDIDESEMGVELEWMSISEQLDEITNHYPGIVAIKHGYLPFGKCLVGSGDPYFLKLDSLESVYRIPHEAVINDKLETEEIELVSSLELLFDYLE